MAKKNHIREVITKNKTNQVAFKRLKKEKTTVEAKLRRLKVDYSSLKEQIQDIVLQLGSNNKLLQAIYNKVDILKREILEAKTT